MNSIIMDYFRMEIYTAQDLNNVIYYFYLNIYIILFLIYFSINEKYFISL
jgi:hypothetical protein